MPDTLQETADLINFDYSGESRAEIIPVDNDEMLVMFANTIDHTRIYIRVDTGIFS